MNEKLIETIEHDDAITYMFNRLVANDNTHIRAVIERVRTRPFESFYDEVRLSDYDDDYIMKVEFPDEIIELYKEEYEYEDEDEDEREWQAIEQLKEDLSYWIVYYEPHREDVNAAIECDLIPFEYDGRFFLALGGCGMDLSPKLDAYQALTDGTIPPESKLFSDRKYFEYVVGKELTKKVIEKIMRPRPRVTIYIE